MIAGCGQLGIDWRTLDLSDYLETLEAYNKAHDTSQNTEGKPKEPSERLRKFAAAHGIRGGKQDGSKAIGGQHG